jgi:hypothetical protein
MDWAHRELQALIKTSVKLLVTQKNEAKIYVKDQRLSAPLLHGVTRYNGNLFTCIQVVNVFSRNHSIGWDLS